MILFFAEGECDSDAFVKHCYAHFVQQMRAAGYDYPEDAEIVREYGEKPRFNKGDAHFSLSHSHGVMMLGIARTEIGVDIEKSAPSTWRGSASSASRTRASFSGSGRRGRAGSNSREQGSRTSSAPSRKTPTSSTSSLSRVTRRAYAQPPQDVRAYLIDLSAVEGRDGEEQ